MIAPCLAFSLVNLVKPGNTSQFILIKVPNSVGLNNFLINGGVPVILYRNMLTFRDSNKSYKLDGDLLKTSTDYNFNVAYCNPQDKKLNYEFGKEVNFNIKEKGRKVTQINLLKNYLTHLLS